ncbi:endo alpha-1,4 polygalactosaminidase [bacterium]|nr:endo alpha-1,4 polygalactosaminidase [bacterium]
MPTFHKLLLALNYSVGVTMFLGCSSKHLQSPLATKSIDTWVCVYNEHVAPQEIMNFDLAVLDADARPDLTELKNSDTVLIGYVSLGEVGDYRWFWPEMQNKPWVLDKNPNWNSYMIDVRAGEWHELLIQKIIPKVLADGFDGIFLDTIDTAEYLEKYHPKIKYPGTQAAMTTLIKSIRRRFPNTYLIANRGFSILEEIADVIDGVVAESVFTTVDLQNEGRTRFLNESEYAANLDRLLRIKKRSNITVFTLDYIGQDRREDIDRLVSKSRRLGFVPYISTPSLDSIYLNSVETIGAN